MLLLWGVVPGWISSAQQQGVSMATLQEYAGADAQLWSLPQSTDDFTGLGNEISWAWDPAMCELISPHLREKFMMVHFVDCEVLHAHVRRAFDTWAANHNLIGFNDVSKTCERNGEPLSNCSLAEISFVDMRDGRIPAEAGDAPAFSVRAPRYSGDFKFTNGRGPRSRVVDGKATTSNTDTVSGVIGINVHSACWYVDTEFCNVFHKMKTWEGWTPDGVFALLVSILFSVWGLAMLAIVWRLYFALRKQLEMRIKIDTDGDGVEMHEVVAMLGQRGEAFIEVMSKQSLPGTTLRLLCAAVPWGFYAILYTCWNCWDFEAALAHQIGQLLGIGVPDPMSTTYHHAGLSADIPLNTSNCVNPWAQVSLGTPSGVELGMYGTPSAVMEPFTRHNPKVCLTRDDLEALNVLYPQCEQAAIMPACFKTDTNVGFLMSCTKVLLPAAFALVLAVLLHTFIDRHMDRKSLSDKAKVLIMSKLLERQRHTTAMLYMKKGTAIAAKEGRWGQAGRSAVPHPSSF